MNEMLSSLSWELFVEAQELMYSIALNEVRNGRKRGHWIWHISSFYGIDGIDE